MFGFLLNKIMLRSWEKNLVWKEPEQLGRRSRKVAGSNPGDAKYFSLRNLALRNVAVFYL